MSELLKERSQKFFREMANKIGKHEKGDVIQCCAQISAIR